LLDRIEVRGRGAVMNIARAVDRPGEEEDPLGERGLAGVDVSCALSNCPTRDQMKT
jgi:hypothetical protein